MVFTGGDPLKRPDLFTLLRKSVALGLRTSIRASATPLLTREAVQKFEDAGVERMAIGLDGWDALSHDEYRGVPGTFACSMRALEAAREIGLDTQVQTTVTGANQHRLAEIAALVEQVKARAWSLTLAGDELEKIFRNIYEISQWASFDIRTEDVRYQTFLNRRLTQLGEVAESAPPGVSEGRGFVFISHTGEIHPSGFLPVSAGNVRYDSLAEVYRNSSLFSIICENQAAGAKAPGGHYAKYAEVRGLALML
jgi:MoaA/NifB/PqqE/SkfB family radical SAM enzyme